MKDPNYRFMFVDDNVMRVRNAIFVVVGIWGVLWVAGLRRVLLRKYAVLSAELDLSGQVVVVRPAMWLVQSRKTMDVEASAEVVFTEMPAMHFQGKNTYPRVVEVRSRGSRLRNGAHWALDMDSISGFVEFLREEGVAVTFVSKVSSRTFKRKSRRRRRRKA